MKHYLNVCGINGAEVEPVDIITFGSPCQDLSIAGKRKGLMHESNGDETTTRSGLFFEAIRIIKEMRAKTNGKYPRYAIYENVPGAFSSNKGWDFHAVLEALCSVCDSSVSIPEPYDKKRTDRLVWLGAGEIVGNGYSVAWRTLDAQYWGVPQRRKRIYLVSDFTGQRAGEILFKPDSLRGDMSQSDETGEGAAADAVGGVDGSTGDRCIAVDGYNQTANNTFGAIRSAASDQDHVGCVVYALQGNGIDRSDTAGCNGCGWREGEMYTLNTIDRPAVCYDARNYVAQEKSGTLQAKSNGGQSLNFINPVCYGVGNGQADQTDMHEIIGTLNCMHDQQAIVYDARGNGDGETVNTLTGDHQDRITDYTTVAVLWNGENISPTLTANNAGGNQRMPDKDNFNAVIQKAKFPRKYIIRRLTPTECARLQGFPDDWGKLAPYNPADADFWESVRKTHAEINGKKYKPTKNLKRWYDSLHTDSAEYKAYGNGLALPCAEFVLHNLSKQGVHTLGSLFDGIGGFPLAGSLNGISPLWSSEIEPYPIAVTVSRFRNDLKEQPQND